VVSTHLKKFDEGLNELNIQEIYQYVLLYVIIELIEDGEEIKEKKFCLHKNQRLLNILNDKTKEYLKKIQKIKEKKYNIKQSFPMAYRAIGNNDFFYTTKYLNLGEEQVRSIELIIEYKDESTIKNYIWEFITEDKYVEERITAKEKIIEKIANYKPQCSKNKLYEIFSFNKAPNKTERKGLVTSRVGQGEYRQNLLEKWGNKCAITKSEIPQILIASHIKPWADSNDEERHDQNNGILLSPNLDALFDRKLIGFDVDGKIMLSSSISKEQYKILGINENMKLDEKHVNQELKKYLEYHRTKFKQNDNTKSLFKQNK